MNLLRIGNLVFLAHHSLRSHAYGQESMRVRECIPHTWIFSEQAVILGMDVIGSLMTRDVFVAATFESVLGITSIVLSYTISFIGFNSNWYTTTNYACPDHVEDMDSVHET